MLISCFPSHIEIATRATDRIAIYSHPSTIGISS